MFWPELLPATGQVRGTALISVKRDGSDKKTHVTFPAADEIIPSPDGSWVAFQEGDNVYVSPLVWGGLGASTQRVEKRRATFGEPDQQSGHS